jgi:DNA-binding LacI/PurR family transcriptional regulator
VVDRVLINLQQEGLIAIRKPAGIFKVEPEKCRIILLCFREIKWDEASFYTTFLNAMNERLIGDNRKIEIVSGQDAVLSALEHRERAVYLTFRMNWQELSLLGGSSRPLLHVLPNFVEELPGMVSVDDAGLIETQIKYLVDKGHKRIAYFHGYRPDEFARARNMRWEAFHRFGIEYRLDMRKEYFFFTDGREEISCNAVKHMLSLSEPPTAIMLPNDSSAQTVYLELMANGITPGKEIAVMGSNNRVWGKFMIPPLTSVGFDYDIGFDRMLEMIKQAEQGEQVGTVRMPAKLAARASA